ncbi:MAG: hypothetical protein QM564_13085 [Bergeyella sp.]
MKILLSSIAKNDIRLLMRVFNAEEKGKGIRFLENLKDSASEIATHPETADEEYKEIRVIKMADFPAHIHYTVNAQEDYLLITAVFKENKD